MLFQILRSNADPQTLFLQICALILSVVLAIVMHELAHGFIAYKQGDMTAKMQGRLTFNPVKHFDIFGFGMMLFAGFGWAKPVPINPYNFRKPRKGLFLVSIAGVVTNLILALVFFLLGRFVLPLLTFNEIVYIFFYMLFYYSMSLNISLAAFNLLPVFPLDGFRIIESLTRPHNKFCMFMRKYGTFIFIVLVALSYIAPYVGLPWLDVIGSYMDFISSLVMKLFGLI